MLTTIMATRPVPRLRNGRQRPRSFSQPKTPDAMIAKMIATASVTLTPPIEIDPGRASTAKAARAPKVTSSPWAKLVSPVVPKIIERPRAAMASSSAKTSPPTASCRAWVALPVGRRAVADGEGHPDVVVDLGSDVEGDLLGVAERRTLGEGLPVDLDGERLAEVVDGGARQRDVEDAGRVAGAGADLLSRVVLDRDRDVGDRLGGPLSLVDQATLDVDRVVVPRRRSRRSGSADGRRRRRAAAAAGRSPDGDDGGEHRHHEGGMRRAGPHETPVASASVL